MPKKITEAEYSEYERILKKYQRMRRAIIRGHKSLIEQSRAPSRLPQMVAPERETKISLAKFRLTGRRIFALKMRQLKKLVSGGFQEFYKEYKYQYLELYQRLLDESPEGYTALQLYNHYNKGFKLGNPILYSEDQIKFASKDEAEFMRNYNAIVRMNPMVFAYLIKSGRMPEFRHLYQQFLGEVRTQENWLDAMSKAIKMARNFSPIEAERLLLNPKLSKSNKEKLKTYAKKQR